ncbi:hypothetical protein [Pseudomonas cremoricolorata]|uniref:Inducer of phenazine A n=1 Tax=Pseudomonas cremoricolorata TaxID=157783 RepID=A0A089WU54_9PSED|nr:hypothetical protein [Pseudomonas cremoricolorata]AIR90724.1 hypothetical protein LK03_16230 [Pseudomonas cremoricolorata]
MTQPSIPPTEPGAASAAALAEDYQRFIRLGHRRLPLTLYMQERDYRSATLNTDALGLRYSHWSSKRLSLAERGGLARVNLLVGGSTAQGIGASCDARTVASFLSTLSGEAWLSLAGCGLNATQELMLFLTHQHRLSKVGHVVVLSGLNTLAHEALAEWVGSDPAQTELRACEQFLSTFHEGMQVQPRADSIWQRLRERWFCTPAPLRIAAAPCTPPEQRLMRAADCIGRTLRQWQQLLAGSDTTLTFMLQPWLPWCREELPPGEQVMLAALQRQAKPFDGLLAGIGAEHHAGFFRRIKRQADEVPCYDMNGMLSSSPVFAEQLFIDRLHFNDLGNNALAKVITAKLGLAQEKHPGRKGVPVKLV